MTNEITRQAYITYWKAGTNQIALNFIITLSDCRQYVNFEGIEGPNINRYYQLPLVGAIEHIWYLKTFPHHIYQKFFGCDEETRLEVEDGCKLGRLVGQETLETAV